MGGTAAKTVVGAGNVRLVREYGAYLRVERGLRENSCEAYVRDLEQFAEFLEKHDGVLSAAAQEDVRGVSGGAACERGWRRVRWRAR